MDNGEDTGAGVTGGGDFFGELGSGLTFEDAEGVQEEQEEQEVDTEEEEELEPERQESEEEGDDDSEEEEEEYEDEGEEDAPEGDIDNFSEVQGVFDSLAEDGLLDIDPEKEYEPSMEGVKEILKDALSKPKAPDLPSEVEGFLKYREAMGGATLEEYYESLQEEDYNNYNPNQEKDAHWLLEDDMRERGMSNEEIEDELHSLKERKLLSKRAGLAKKRLLASQEKRGEAKMQAQEVAKQKQVEARQAAADNFSKRVHETDDVRGFALGTAKEKKALIEYATKAVGANGETQYQLDQNPEDELLFLMIKKNKMTLDTLRKKATTRATVNFKKKVQAATDRGVKKGKRTKAASGKPNNKIEWNFHKQQ